MTVPVSAERHPGQGTGPERVLDALVDAYVAVDSDGMITGWNRAAIAMFGWSAEEAVGAALVGLVIPPEARSAHQRAFAAAIRTGRLSSEGRPVPVLAVRRDGTTLPVELTIGALPDDDTGGCFFAVVRDVTDRQVPTGRATNTSSCGGTPSTRCRSGWL